jgi:hypothetical protein
MTTPSMCPHCGRLFEPADMERARIPSKIPEHAFPDHPIAGRYWLCPGGGQHPRNPESDRRPLWAQEPLTPPGVNDLERLRNGLAEVVREGHRAWWRDILIMLSVLLVAGLILAAACVR